MSIVLKGLKWFLITFISLFVLLYLILLLVNLHDEPLLQEYLAQESAFYQLGVDEKQNGFIFALGLDAPKGVNSFEYGRQKIQTLQSNFLKSKNEILVPNTNKADLKAFEQELENIIGDCQYALASSNGNDCFSILEKNKAELETLYQEWQWLHQRYLTILNKPVWRELSTELSNLLTSLSQAKKLHDIAIFIALSDLELDKANSYINAEFVFLTRVTSSTYVLINKAIMSNYLKQHLLLNTKNISRLEKEKRFIPSAWQNSLSKNSWQLNRVVVGEQLYAKEMMLNLFNNNEELPFLTRLTQTLAQPLFQVNHTLNLHFKWWREVSELSSHSIELLPEEFAKVEYNNNNDKEDSIFDYLHWYNPIGEIINTTNKEYTTQYISAASDIEGLRQLSLLYLNLIQNEGIDSVAFFIARSEFQNPYTAKPFQYNGNTQRISFTGLNEENTRTDDLAYFLNQ